MLLRDYEGAGKVEPITHAPGIYLGMTYAEYAADPALGSTSIHELGVSPITYWRNSSLNPNRVQDETEATGLGTAFHARFLEGRDVFEARYAPSLREEDHPEALKVGDAMRAWLKARGLKTSGLNAELEARILEADPSAPLWSRLQSEHGRKHAGREFLPQQIIDRIEATAAHLAAHPDASKALTGGHSEASLFWEDSETGIRLKARIDKLKARAAVDLKSFANKYRRPVDRAIADSMGRYGYIAQAAHYSNGIEHVKALLRNNDAVVRGPASQDFIDRLAASGPHRFIFVFVESCAYPAIRVRECARFVMGPDGKPTAEETLYWQAGQQAVRRAIETYDACMKAFGPDRPWLDVAPLSSFTEEELFYTLDK